MNRVVVEILRGVGVGKYSARVEHDGTYISLAKFWEEEDAWAYLNRFSDDQLAKIMNRRGKSLKYDKESLKKKSNEQVSFLSYKYLFMKSNLSAAEATAIKRFCDERGAVPQMSVFPIVTFKIRETGEIVNKHLKDLVHEDKVAREEESKTRADEKKRIERENKWKPITDRSSY